MYPGIEVNSYYRQMNQAPDSQELKEYLGNKIRQAEWVKQLYHTAQQNPDGCIQGDLTAPGSFFLTRP